MNEQQVAKVQQVILPLLEAAGQSVTNHFYQRMFAAHPELKNIFNLTNQHTGRQQFALFNAVAAYIKYLHMPEVLQGTIERIANKHASLQVLEAHYPIVGLHLTETIRELAPQAFTPDVEHAWKQAYDFLANILIKKEAGIYSESANASGGWQGARIFRLTEKNKESELVTSFIFEPSDGAAIKAYKPGQYIGLELKIPGTQYNEIRQYSLSEKFTQGRYRISVKRELNTNPGLVSNYLHDQLTVGDEVSLHAPVGDFFLAPGDNPVVLMSAGVGLTPMQAMLETIAADNESNQLPRKVFYLHACETAEQHSFKSHNLALVKQYEFPTYIWYRNDDLSQQQNSRLLNFLQGYMDVSVIKSALPLMDGDFYLCGPTIFMKLQKQQLLTLGVAEDRIHYEVFGPHDDF